jgi:hypothetical protein
MEKLHQPDNQEECAEDAAKRRRQLDKRVRERKLSRIVRLLVVIVQPLALPSTDTLRDIVRRSSPSRLRATVAGFREKSAGCATLRMAVSSLAPRSDVPRPPYKIETETRRPA